jgi:hypothetical protein
LLASLCFICVSLSLVIGVSCKQIIIVPAREEPTTHKILARANDHASQHCWLAQSFSFHP